MAEAHLGEPVTKAAVAIPSSFLHGQREATRAAAIDAGFKTVELIQEPTATAVAYGFEKQPDGSKILIFDLGAANLDVSVVAVQDKETRVLGTSGLAQFGGIFFEQNVHEHVRREFKKKFNREMNWSEIVSLRSVCGKAMRELDVSTVTSISIPNANFTMSLSRDTFVNLNKDYFQIVTRPIEEALANAKLSKSDIQHFILVGRSSRIVTIRETVIAFFGGKQPEKCDLLNRLFSS